MSIEQSVIFCDYNTRLMDVPKSCFLPNKIGHKTTNMPYKFIYYHAACIYHFSVEIITKKLEQNLIKWLHSLECKIRKI